MTFKIPIFWRSSIGYGHRYVGIFTWCTDALTAKIKGTGQPGFTVSEMVDDREVMVNIYDLAEVERKVFYLLDITTKEILVLFVTSNAFLRQKRNRSIQLLKDIKSKRPGLAVKVLTPKGSEVEREAGSNIKRKFQYWGTFYWTLIKNIDPYCWQKILPNYRAERW